MRCIKAMMILLFLMNGCVHGSEQAGDALLSHWTNKEPSTLPDSKIKTEFVLDWQEKEAQIIHDSPYLNYLEKLSLLKKSRNLGYCFGMSTLVIFSSFFLQELGVYLPLSLVVTPNTGPMLIAATAFLFYGFNKLAEKQARNFRYHGIQKHNVALFAEVNQGPATDGKDLWFSQSGELLDREKVENYLELDKMR